jgi:hypothetical protein
MHRDQNIAATDELLLDVQLRDRGPVRVLLDSRPELRILQHVESSELVGVDTLQTEDLDAGSREAALRCLGCSLHEEHDGCGGYGLVDCLLGLVGEEAPLGEGGLEAEDGRGGWPEGLLGWELAGCAGYLTRL